ncbi:hypothetical protein [Acinetobacter baumannii]|uniref:hypothetical protein n=1 Tax=Acinetobacter baumannii TaxID=470 RepID=UPI000B20C8A9|nr:hypothetical protein [Acinetobacter baumannii]AVN04375.1 hypothetical protein C7R87_3841 [Acinetobacter baumannii]
MDKKFGYIVIAITIFIFVIFVYGLFRNFIEVSDKLDFTPLKYIVGFVLTLVILVSSISSYLDSNKSSSNLFYELMYGQRKRKIKQYTELFNKSIEEGYYPFSEKNNNINMEEVTNEIRNKIELASTESYFKEFKDKVRVEAIVDFFIQEAKGIETRVKGEINRLSKSAIINLSRLCCTNLSVKGFSAI